ncbi:TPA: hypothetical protein U9D74_001401 [Streptococcus agalactiae]|nr:hypothetical protein [Streptococcus agalactiae]
MKNFVMEVVGYTYNGKDLETTTRLAGYMDNQTRKVVITSDIDKLMQSLLKETGNVFCPELEIYSSRFIFYSLTRLGYEVYDSYQVDPEHMDKFVRVNRKSNGEHNDGSFTVYTANPNAEDGFDMLNFKDSESYVTDSIQDLAYIYKEPYKDFEKIPFNKKTVKTYQVTPEEETIMKDHLRVLDRTMQEQNFYKAYENRIYSISSLAMQMMIAETDDLGLKTIIEFEPVTKFSGFGVKHIQNGDKVIETRKKYYEKRYTKKSITKDMRSRVPSDLNLENREHTDGLLKELEELVDLMEDMYKNKEYGNYKSKRYLVSKINQVKKYHTTQKRDMFRALRNENGRIAYRSGYNYINPYYNNDWIEKIGITIDQNSQYASIYKKDKLPNEYVANAKNLREFNKKYGNGDYLYIANVTELKATCREGYVPIIKPKKDELASFGTMEQVVRQNSYNFDVEMHYTFFAQPDFEYLLEAYDIHKIEYSLMVMSVDYDLMDKMVKHEKLWGAKKEQAKRDGNFVEYTHAKTMLNRVVGGLGVNKTNIYAQSYVAAAGYINSKSRVNTARLINKIGLEYFCYSAVDSVHLILPDEVLDNGQYNKEKTFDYLKNTLDLDIDAIKVGAWKLENVWKRAKYINASVYGELNIYDEWESKVSGFSGQIPMEQFEGNALLTNKTYKAVKGGVLLLETPYGLGKMEIFD